MEVLVSVNWLCGGYGLSVGENERTSVCSVSHLLLASLCPRGSEPEVSKGCQMEFGLLPTFFLLDASLLPAPVSCSYSGVVHIEQAELE